MTDEPDPTPEHGGEPADGETLRERVAHARSGVVEAINARVPGAVTLHYEARDVVIPVSGDVALRMMTVFRRQRSDGLADVLGLSRSLALNGWTTISMAGLLAITWDPGPDADEAVGSALLNLLHALEEPDAAVAKVGKLARAEANAAEAFTDDS